MMKNLTKTFLWWMMGWIVAVTSLGQEVQIQIQHVAGAVHMLEGSGGNIAVSIREDGPLIVDTQFPELAPQIEQALDSLDKGSLQYVLNTRWHGDHTGGNDHFGAKAKVIAHEEVRQCLSEKSNTPDKALPAITFRESSSLFFNDEEIRMLHLGPGHTDDDAIIWFTQSNVIHMRDQFFKGRFPYIDLASGGQAEGYLRNVQTVLNHLPEEARIIPGHGKLATR